MKLRKNITLSDYVALVKKEHSTWSDFPWSDVLKFGGLTECWEKLIDPSAAVYGAWVKSGRN